MTRAHHLSAALAGLGLALAGCAASGSAQPPIGFISFCLRYAEACQPVPDAQRPAAPAPAVMTAARWQELHQVNAHINTAISPLHDTDNTGRLEWWTYPDTGRGDCEEYALEKRRALLARGWPAHALLITVGETLSGEPHAVLTVVTDHGDLVLDNLSMTIVEAGRAPYRWHKRQSRHDPLHWVRLDREGRP